MTVQINHREWAREVFGGSKLDDRRRTKRLIDYAARQAANAEASTHAVCLGDSAAAEGAYRFLRNEEVAPERIAESGFAHTVSLCGEAEVVLAIQDTTSLGYEHSICAELGDLGGEARTKKRGFWVHSTLAMDGGNGEVYGLLDQQWWVRRGRRKKRGENKKIPYEEKESFKWQRAVEQVARRVGGIERVVMVGDREADVHEYLEFMVGHGYRYVVRAERNRLVGSEMGHLWEEMYVQPVAGRQEVRIPQKGGRPARRVEVEIRYGRVQLRPPVDFRKRGPIWLDVVLVSERRSPGSEKKEEALEWMLLTSEEVNSLAEAERVVGWYRRRWTIEDFHKAWKTGCGAEERRFQSAGNMQRALTILAFVAVRLLQLRNLSLSQPEAPCDKVLSKEQWVCLWALSQEGKEGPVPAHAPSLRWAVEKIANLGGWIKSKQTTAIGWQTLWRGWQKLDERVIGFLAAQIMHHDK
jgi:hypothetical protein